MKPKLKNRIYFMAGFIFNLLQCVYIPGIQNDRFFTDRVRLMTKCKSDMGIVKIIGRTDAYIVNFSPCSFKFIKMSVKPFEFHKKVTVRKIAIDATNAVKFIKACKKI